MMKFLRPNKNLLKNAQRYAMLEAFVTVFTEAGYTHWYDCGATAAIPPWRPLPTHWSECSSCIP